MMSNVLGIFDQLLLKAVLMRQFEEKRQDDGDRLLSTGLQSSHQRTIHRAGFRVNLV